MEQGEGRDHHRHLGQPQQPVEADDLDRDPVSGEGVEHLGRRGVVAGQYADPAPGAGLSRVLRERREAGLDGVDLAGEPGQLGGRTGVEAGAHLARADAVGGAQRRDRHRGVGVERLGEAVGGLEDRGVRAATHREVVERDLRRAVGAREGAADVEDVGDRGAAPAVDRLVGVADGGHGVAPAVLGIRPREQGAEQLRLGDRGVLVLVEEHDPEPRPLRDADVGMVASEPGGQRDLVGEVHQPEVGLEPAVVLDEPQQLGPLGDLRDDLLEVGLRLLRGDRRLERDPLAGVEGADVVGGHQVLAHRAVEGQQVADDVLGTVGEELHPVAVPGDGTAGELVAGGVGHHPGVGLVPDPQSLLGEQRGGVGVVGGDGGLDPLVVVGGDVGQQPGPGERGPDVGGELAGGLGGEGEPEDLVGTQLPGRHQEHHPRRHQRGLARAGAGDHDRGLERRGDRRPLLLADREAGLHHLLQLRGAADRASHRARHDSTVPDCWAGQSSWKSQCSHTLPGRTSSASERTTRTAAISCSSTGR